MHTLRLVGIHEDGEHLLFADAEGDRYQVPLDDPLRAAVRRERPRLPGDASNGDAEPLRPREVQALIRSGVTLEEVAERSGWDLEKVQRYEPPIRAERDYVAGQARALPVGGSGVASTMGERVAQRLADRGVDAERVGWDAWKETTNAWKVVCLFPAGGRERRASWRFNTDDRTLVATDDEARWLGEDEHGKSTAPHSPKVTSARSVTVYDVEAEGGVAGQSRARSARPAPTPASDGGESTVDLMSVMRERAASRRARPKKAPSPADPPIPAEEMPQEARPVERLEFDPDDAPPAGSRGQDEPVPEGATEQAAEDGPVTGTLFDDLEAVSESRERKRQRGIRKRSSQRGKTVAEAQEAEPDSGSAAPDADADRADEDVPVQDKTDEDVPARDKPDEEAAAAEPVAKGSTETDDKDAAPDVPARQSATRQKRPSVPSWDDIMFGSRRED